MDPLFEKNLITTKDAGELSGYTSDYLARLARSGKIVGTRIGHSWLIDKESLTHFLDQQGNRKIVRARTLARAREAEYRAHHSLLNPPNLIRTHKHIGHISMSDMSDTNIGKSSFPRDVSLREMRGFRGQVLALSVALVVVVTGSVAAQAAVIPQLAHHVAMIASDIASGFNETFGGIPSHIAEKISAVDGAMRIEPARIAIANEISTSNIAPLDFSSVQLPSFENTFVARQLGSWTSKLPTNAPTNTSILTVETLQSFARNAYANLTSPSLALNTFVHAYVAIGIDVYAAINTSFAAYHSLIEQSGAPTLALAASARDILATSPRIVDRANLAFGTAIIEATHALIHADVATSYGLAAAAPASARATVALVGSVGDVLALATSRAPVLAQTLYLRATAAPARVAPALARAVFNAEYAGATHFIALSRIVSDRYLALIQGTGRLAYVGAKGTRDGIDATGPLLASTPLAFENAYLGVLGKSALALDTLARVPKVAAVLSAVNTVTAPMLAAVASKLSVGEQIALATYETIHNFLTSTGRMLAMLFAPTPTIVLPSGIPKSRIVTVNNYPTYTTVVQGVSSDFLNKSLVSLRTDILSTVAGMIQPVATQTALNLINMYSGSHEVSFLNIPFLSATNGSFTNLNAGTTNLGNTTVTGDLTVSGTITPAIISAGTSISAPYFIATSATATSTFAGHFAVGTSSPWGDSIFLVGTSTPLLHISSNTGRIGVGTSSPSVHLSVAGSGYFTNGLGVGAVNTAPGSLLTTATTTALNFITSNFGTAGAPAYTFLGNTNTGLWSPSANMLAWSTGGSERMRLNDVGNLGIGTSSPFATLSVAGNGFFNGNLTAANMTATGTLAVAGLSTFVNASTTNLSVANNLWVGGNATTTSNGNFTTNGNLAVRGVTNDIAGTLNLSGGALTSTAALSITSGGAGDLSLTSGSSNINIASGNSILATGANSNLGSAGIKFNTLYVNTVNATTLVGTVSGGATNSSDWTINAAAATDQTMNLIFDRGGSVTNALLTWNATLHRFDFNQNLHVSNDVLSPASTTLALQAVAGQTGALTNWLDSSGNVLGTVTSNGYLGVGTSSPFAKLSLAGTAGGSTNFLAISTSTSLFATTTALTVDANGNLSLLNGANLTVGGNLTITGTQTYTGLATFGNGFLSNASSTITSGLFTMSGGASTTAFTASGQANLASLAGASVSSLTANYLPKWNSGTFANSLVYDNGTNVGIGTSTPQWNLQVAGTRPSFALSDTSAGANLKHWLFSSMGGNLYIGTSTDAYGTSTPAALTISNAGNAVFAGTITATSFSFASPLATTNGGTGTTTWQTGSIPYFNGTRLTEDNSNLFWDGANHRLGIGTTSPYSMLSVAGQVVAQNFMATSTTATSTFAGGFAAGLCVTGDTKMRRRRRRKDGSYEYDEPDIKDIKEGDEIQSLDEKTGKLVWSRVKQLAFMGVKDIFKITTASGKTIRTTGNHPYLVAPKEIEKRKLRIGVFIDSGNLYHTSVRSGWRIDFGKLKNILSRVADLAFVHYHIAVPRENDPNHAKTVSHMQKVSSSFIVCPKPMKYIWSDEEGREIKKGDVDVDLAMDVVRNLETVDATIVVSGDSDYLALEKYAAERGNPLIFMSYKKNMAWELRLKNHMFFDLVRGCIEYGVKTNSDLSAGATLTFSIIHKAVLESINAVDNQKAIENENGAPITDTPVFRATDAFNGSIASVDISYQDTLPFVKGGSWKKVVDIREGQMIATTGANGKPMYERIIKVEKLPAEDVYDVEIEGTHNFIGNDIVAHNTAFVVNQGAPAGSLYVAPSGNVGIGTTSPQRQLSLWQSNASQADLPQFVIEQQGTGDSALQFLLPGIQAWNVGIDKSDSNKFKISSVADATWSGARLTIDNSGNVGIGTTNPLNKLDFGTSVANVAKILTLYQSGTTMMGFGMSGSTAGMRIFGPTATADEITFGSYDGTTYTEQMRINTSGNVGIGTTGPGTTLDVANYFRVLGSPGGATGAPSLGNGLQITYDTTNDVGYITSLSAPSASYKKLTINASVLSLNPNSLGNVGIGTTTPAYKLDVDGVINSGDTVQGHYLIGGVTVLNQSSLGSSVVGSSLTSVGTLTSLNVSGNVGIGTTNPQANLEVSGNIAIGTHNDGQTRHVGLYQSGTPTTWLGGMVTTSNAGTGDTTTGFITNEGGVGNGVRMLIDKNGNVGIGTTTVSSGKVIIDNHLSGSQYSLIVGSDTTGRGIQLNTTDYVTAVSGTSLRIGMGAGTGNSTYALIDNTSLGLSGAPLALNPSGGNVGIGTTGPSEKLSVVGNIELKTAGVLRMRPVANDWNMDIGVTGTPGATSMNFVDGGSATPLMVIKTSGNVGIGTTSPVSKLHVSGSGGIYAKIEDTTSFAYLDIKGGQVGDADWALMSGYPNAGDFTIREAGVANWVTVKKTTGNVGIGTTGPADPLDVRTTTSGDVEVLRLQAQVSGAGVTTEGSGIGFYRNQSNGQTHRAAYIAGYGTSASDWGGDLAFFTHPSNGSVDTGVTERMRINAAGNVGIGTTNPATKLDVNGNATTGTTIASRVLETGVGYGILTGVYRYNSTIDLGGLWFIPSGTAATNANYVFSADSGGNSYFNSNSTGKIYFGNSNTYKMTLSAAGGLSLGSTYYTTDAGAGNMIIQGNVGIGTTSPATKLEVGGSTNNVTLDGYLNCTGFTTNANGLVACTASDERLKENISLLATSSALAGIDALNSVSFNWRDASMGTNLQFGLIAQQVQNVFPNLVQITNQTVLTPGGTLTVNYIGLISPMIRAIQELDARTRQILGSEGVLSIVPGVKSQCVTGDTKLRRRRKAQRTGNLGIGAADFDELEFDEICIRDIVPGDEIQSLDERIGTVVYARVNALMDMGTQEVFELRTASGRTIRTTSNHPFLARIKTETV